MFIVADLVSLTKVFGLKFTICWVNVFNQGIWIEIHHLLGKCISLYHNEGKHY